VPKRPFAAIVGGSKVSSKIGVIESLMSKCDKIVIGGGMVFTFLKARGLKTGSSLVEDDKVELAKSLEAKAKKLGVKFILPTDVVLADKFAADANTKVVSVENIPDGWMGLDNGPESTKMIQKELSDCKTIIWNGPMGVFEMEKFAKGTNDVAKTLAECTSKGAITIIGGGDSVAAVEAAGLAEKMSHISTGGGASLELLGPGPPRCRSARLQGWQGWPCRNWHRCRPDCLCQEEDAMGHVNDCQQVKRTFGMQTRFHRQNHSVSSLVSI